MFKWKITVDTALKQRGHLAWKKVGTEKKSFTSVQSMPIQAEVIFSAHSGIAANS